MDIEDLNRQHNNILSQILSHIYTRYYFFLSFPINPFKYTLKNVGEIQPLCFTPLDI